MAALGRLVPVAVDRLTHADYLLEVTRAIDWRRSKRQQCEAQLPQTRGAEGLATPLSASVSPELVGPIHRGHLSTASRCRITCSKS